LFVHPKRLGGTRARYRMGVQAIPTDVGSTLDERVLALTRAFAAALERTIEEAPEQYFWFHDRWKTRPEGLT
jgi:KDO2-lipid IV(A) lauroyltransferase